MKYLVIVVAVMLAGCSSSMPNPDADTLDTRMNISQEINAVYCDQEGFSKLHEGERYYTFTCANGTKFRIPK